MRSKGSEGPGPQSQGAPPGILLLTCFPGSPRAPWGPLGPGRPRSPWGKRGQGTSETPESVTVDAGQVGGLLPSRRSWAWPRSAALTTVAPGRACRAPRAAPPARELGAQPLAHLPWLLCCQPLQPGPGAPQGQGPPVRRGPVSLHSMGVKERPFSSWRQGPQVVEVTLEQLEPCAAFAQCGQGPPPTSLRKKPLLWPLHPNLTGTGRPGISSQRQRHRTPATGACVSAMGWSSTQPAHLCMALMELTALGPDPPAGSTGGDRLSASCFWKPCRMFHLMVRPRGVAFVLLDRPWEGVAVSCHWALSAPR